MKKFPLASCRTSSHSSEAGKSGKIWAAFMCCFLLLLDAQNARGHGNHSRPPRQPARLALFGAEDGDGLLRPDARPATIGLRVGFADVRPPSPRPSPQGEGECFGIPWQLCAGWFSRRVIRKPEPVRSHFLSPGRG